MDLGLLAAELARAGWGWVAAAGALGLAGLWARARRWRYLFPPGAEPPGLLAGMMIGYMANNVLPLRAGEVVRIYVVARRLRAAGVVGRGEGFWLVAATLAIERVLDSLAIVAMLALLVLVIPVPPALQWGALVLFAIDLGGIAALVAVARAPAACRRLLGRLTGRWPAVARFTAGAFDVAVRGLDGIRSPGHALPLACWTAALWALPALAAWVTLRAVGLDLGWVAGWTVLAFVGLGISIPSAPGYLGVWHAAAKTALQVFGVGDAVAAAFAVLYHASAYVPVTLVGWLFLLREHVSLGEAARAGEAIGPARARDAGR